MPFAAMSLVLSLVASLYALMGHCNTDHKTLAACGLYTLAGKLTYLFKPRVQLTTLMCRAYTQVVYYSVLAVVQTGGNRRFPSSEL